MNWIDFAWPTVTGICLTLGLVHLESGLRGASRRTNLLVALIAFVMVVYSVNEWRLMHASAPSQYLARLRVQDFAGSAIAMLLAIFARVYFDAGRRWLLLLGIVVTGLSLTLDLLPTPQLVFRELTRVTQVPTFGGATYAFAEGVRNPWNVIFYVGLALLMVFVGHVSWIQWKRGDCRRAVGAGRFWLVGSSGIRRQVVLAPTWKWR